MDKKQRWLTENHYAVTETLNSGSSPGLKDLEIAVGAPLPSDIIDFYSIDDGRSRTH